MSLIEKTKELQQYQNMLMEAHITTGVEQWNKGFSAHKKETEKILTDTLNHYQSKLAEATKPKLDRRDRTEYIIKLEAKVEVLNELKKKLCQKLE